jgi:hypothetical protein
MFPNKLRTVAGVLLVLAVLGTGLGLSYHGLRAADPVVSPKEAPPPGDQADDLAALRMGRLAAARKAFDSVWGEYQIGLHEEELVYRWSLRVLEAQRAGAANLADEVAAFAGHRTRMKELQKLAPDRLVVVPGERMENGKVRPGLGITKDGKIFGVAELGLRPLHAETTAYFSSEADVWLAQAKERADRNKP